MLYMALDFDRKWQHSLFHPGLDEVPLEAIVDIGMPSSEPPRPIPTDAELDAMETVALVLLDVVAPEEPQMMADDVGNSSSTRVTLWVWILIRIDLVGGSL